MDTSVCCPTHMLFLWYNTDTPPTRGEVCVLLSLKCVGLQDYFDYKCMVGPKRQSNFCLALSLGTYGLSPEALGEVQQPWSCQSERPQKGRDMPKVLFRPQLFRHFQHNYQTCAWASYLMIPALDLWAIAASVMEQKLTIPPNLCPDCLFVGGAHILF